MRIQELVLLLGVALNASGLTIQKRAACSSYTLINTRGTGELQGPSAGFRTMNANILSQVSGGTQHNTVYPADFSQISTAGTRDIVNTITSTLQSNPDECFVLEGYSQGAAATVNALPQLTGAAFDAVVGVFLIGNPLHKSGLACNVDNSGGDRTRDVNGLSAALGDGIPEEWIAKTQDVCIFGDGVCDTTHGFGINAQHLQYPGDADTQNLGTTFVVGALTSGVGGSTTLTSPATTESEAPVSASSAVPETGSATSSDSGILGSLDSSSVPSLGSGLGSLASLGGFSSSGRRST